MKGGRAMRVSTIENDTQGMVQGRNNYPQTGVNLEDYMINRQEEDGKFFSEELEKGIEEINDTIEALNKDLRFMIHEESDRMMVEVINLDKNEVIKEIPPRELLDMIGRIREMVGLIIDEKI